MSNESNTICERSYWESKNNTTKCKEVCIHNVGQGGCDLNEDEHCAIAYERDQNAKADAGKLMMELIPTSAYRSLGAVLTYGAKKYAPNSWQKVDRERYIGALVRHLVAYLDDPNGFDEESGLRHSQHLLCNAMFLDYFAEEEQKND